MTTYKTDLRHELAMYGVQLDEPTLETVLELAAMVACEALEDLTIQTQAALRALPAPTRR